MGFRDERKGERNFFPAISQREEGGNISKQNSQVKWLREEDRNTKFFHNSMVNNRLDSKIYKLKRTNGTQVKTREEIEEELTNHFKEIMIENNIDRGHDIDRIIALIPISISREDNGGLTNLISMQEIEEVMHLMAQGKSPSPDGFTSNFFQFFWDMIKDEV